MFWLLLPLAWLLASAFLGALVGRSIRVAGGEDPQQQLCEGPGKPAQEPAVAVSAPSPAARASTRVAG
jgi:hypothetical protein